MENNKEALAVQESAEPLIESDQLINIAEKAEKRVAAVNKIKRLALGVTNSHDWVSQNKRPYLQASGGEKIARLFGISWRLGEPKKIEEESGHYRYETHGEFIMGNATIEVIGSRSTRDTFFTTRYRDGNKVELPPSEVDEANVMKASITNLIGNGITRMLGIRNLTWEDLATSGIKQTDIADIQYGKKKSVAKPSAPDDSGNGDAKLKGRIAFIHAKLKETGIKEKDLKDDLKIDSFNSLDSDRIFELAKEFIEKNSAKEGGKK